ncbi:MAG TPA: ATP-binding protein [Acidimicrobiales bacterium]|nr:ATP-binding protein [Acidimicrobiales bacterium]
MDQARLTRTDGERFTWRLVADLDAVPIARRAFEGWLRDIRVSDDDVHDLTVVLSELGSNAANGAAPGTHARIESWLDGEVLHLAVANRVDEAATDIQRWDLDDQLRGGGRGLLIVRAYTDSMEIDTAGGEVSVLCTRRLDQPG